MANVIQHKRSSTSGAIPTTGNLSYGELAINYADAKAYIRDSNDNIVNLCSSSISGVVISPSTGVFDVIGFNVDNESILTKGQISWNDTEGTMDIGMDDDVTIHIGEHRFYRIRNETGDTLYKGQPVYATGVHSNGIITPDLYVADGTIREVRFMGVMLENVNNNDNGYAIDFGHLHDMDLDGSVTDYAVGDETWNAGDILYVHPTVAGKLTNIEPKHSISVAIILDRGNGNGNGQMFVRPTSYGHLDDNHDVDISGAINGQMLRYNSSTDYWTTGIIYDNGTNVGIGTNDPKAKLHLSGSTDTLRVGPWFSTSDRDHIELVAHSTDTRIKSPNERFHIENSAGHILITAAASNSVILNEDGNNVDFRVEGDNDQNLLFVDASTDRVGIGTSSPGHKLEVAGASSSINVSDNEVTSYRVGGTAVLGKAKTTSGFSATVDGATRLSGSKIVFTAANDNTVSMTINNSHNVGIGTESPSYKLQVNGSFGATTKSFRIDHPSKPNYTLEYGSLESPYHGVRLTGRGKVVKGSGTVLLPSYLKDLIHHEDGINIQLTSLYHDKTLFVSKIDINNNLFEIKAKRAKTLPDLEFFWTLTGIRKDVDLLQTEKAK